jgi:hypothetical protein
VQRYAAGQRNAMLPLNAELCCHREYSKYHPRRRLANFFVCANNALRLWLQVRDSLSNPSHQQSEAQFKGAASLWAAFSSFGAGVSSCSKEIQSMTLTATPDSYEQVTIKPMRTIPL